jgi:carotenoid cleavage dioxygenase
MGYRGAAHTPPRLHRLEIREGGGTPLDAELAGFVTEFPRINGRFDSLASRFVYTPTLTAALTLPKPPSASFNAMVKVDGEKGEVARHDFGNRLAGEAVFIPRPDGGAEDDGYLATFLYDPQTDSSDLVLLDAAHVEAEPVAVIRLPQRVPQGLHGNWIPKG